MNDPIPSGTLLYRSTVPVLTAEETAALAPPPKPAYVRWTPLPKTSPNPILQPCCDPWAEAMQYGTDGEGYSSAIYNDEPGKPASIGCIDAPIRFCPWCGAPKV